MTLTSPATNTTAAKCWQAFRLQGSRWVRGIMLKVRPGGGGISDEEMSNETEKFCLQTASLVSDVPDKLSAWIKQTEERSSSKYGMKAKAFKLSFDFFLFGSNRKRTFRWLLMAFFLLLARIFNYWAFTLIMATLAGDDSKLLIPTQAISTSTAVVLFVVSTLLTSVGKYNLDRESDSVAMDVYCQMLYCVSSAALRSNSAAFSSQCSLGEVLALLGGDCMAQACMYFLVGWCLIAILEILPLLLLACTQVGIVAGFCGLIPLVLTFPLKVYLLKKAAVHQRQARDLQTKRLDISNDGIAANVPVKLLGAEEIVYNKAMDIRQQEQKHLFWVAMSNAATLSGRLILPAIMAWTAMLATWEQGTAVSSRIFTVYGFYSTIADFDINVILMAVQHAAGGLNGAEHLYEFFRLCLGTQKTQLLKAKDGDMHNKEENKETPLIVFEDVNLHWDLNDSPVLHSVDLKLPHCNQLIGVSGGIGAGKSSLLLALFGELQTSSGGVYRHPDWTDSLAYAAQKAWLPGGSVESTITFTNNSSTQSLDVEKEAQIDEAWLQQVIKGCGLQNDIDGFEHGLQQNIGQGGGALSGGQRARLALARACYARANITILDDVLCALDPGLGDRIFKDVIGEGGLLRGPGRTVIFVTQNLELLPCCDTVVVVKQQTVLGCFPPEEAVSKLDIGKSTLSLQTMSSQAVVVPKQDKTADIPQTSLNPSDSTIIELTRSQPLRTMVLPELESESDAEEEELAVVQQGSGHYLRHLYSVFGPVEGIFAVACLFGASATIYLWQYALQSWLAGNANNEKEDFDDQTIFLILIVIVLAILGGILHFYVFLRGVTRLHGTILRSILYSPLSFFTVHHPSKVYDAVGADATEVEVKLAVSIADMCLLLMCLIGVTIITALGVVYMLAALIPMFGIFFLVQRDYSKSCVPIKRRQASTRQASLHIVGDIVSGLPTIHAFSNRTKVMSERLIAALRFNYCWTCVAFASKYWMNYINNIIIYNLVNIGITVALAIALTPGPSSVGPLILSNVYLMAAATGAAATVASEIEGSLTAVGRLLDLSDLPLESEVVRKALSDNDVDGKGEKTVENNKIPNEWPSSGEVTFDCVTAAYAWSMPPALKNVSYCLPHGTTTGFCGRSGSGKSTSVLVLTGMIPVLDGKVMLDGVNIQDTTIAQLRSAIAMVPQEPVLFTGNVRYNLDPHLTRTDIEMWEMLECCGLKSIITDLGGLDAVFDPQASALSQGNKQLLCLARCLLRDKLLLILDEANASVDGKTEEAMDKIVSDFVAGRVGITKRTRTMIAIAHRLSSILNLDRVVVMKSGEVIESGNPMELAGKNDSVFAEMLDAQSRRP